MGRAVVLGFVPNFGRLPVCGRHGAWFVKKERKDMKTVTKQMAVVMMMISRREKAGIVKAMVQVT